MPDFLMDGVWSLLLTCTIVTALWPIFATNSMQFRFYSVISFFQSTKKHVRRSRRQLQTQWGYRKRSRKVSKVLLGKFFFTCESETTVIKQLFLHKSYITYLLKAPARFEEMKDYLPKVHQILLKTEFDILCGQKY